MANKNDVSRVNTQATLKAVIDKVRSTPFAGVKEDKLRQEVKNRPGFIFEAADFMRVDVVYK